MENKKIKLTELVELYKKPATKNLKEDVLKKNVEYTSYVPFSVKAYTAKEMLNSCMVNGTDLIYDSPQRYIAYVCLVIGLYTNIELTNNSSADYDLLKESGMLKPLFKLIGDDLEEFNTVWKMCSDDIKEEKLSLNGMFKSYVDRVARICNEGLKHISENLNTLDESKIDKLKSIFKK